MLRILFIPLTVNSWFKNKQTNQPQNKQQQHYQPVLLHAVSDDTREKSTDCEITANRLPWKQLCFPPFCFLWSKTGLIALVHDPFHPRALNRRWHTQMNNPRSCRKSTVPESKLGAAVRAAKPKQRLPLSGRFHWCIQRVQMHICRPVVTETPFTLHILCIIKTVTTTMKVPDCVLNGAFFAGKKQPMSKQEP